MNAFKRQNSAGSVRHHEGDVENPDPYRHTPGDAATAQHREDDDRADEAKGRNADEMDKKYWLSVNYIGTMFAIGMAFMGGIGGMRTISRWQTIRRTHMLICSAGFGLVAPVLSTIDADLGPSPNINWVPLVNICGGAVFFLMVGKLSK